MDKFNCRPIFIVYYELVIFVKGDAPYLGLYYMQLFHNSGVFGHFLMEFHGESKVLCMIKLSSAISHF